MGSQHKSVANGLVIMAIPLLQEADRARRILRIPSHEKDLEIRAVAADGVDHLPAVETWQPDIGNQQVDALFGAQNIETRGPSIASSV